MSDTTLNAGDIGRLPKASAAVASADYVLLQRSTTAHLRRATIAQIGAGFQGGTFSSNVTVAGTLSVTGAVTASGGITSTSGSITAPAEIVTNFEKVATTAAQTLAANGISVLSCTVANTLLVLPAPVVGGFKWLRATTTFAQTVTASAATIGSTKTNIVFAGVDQAIVLRGESSSQWGVYSAVASSLGTTNIAVVS